MAFYKREDEELKTAPNFVSGPGFSLSADTRADNVYPVDGWYWFDTLDAALAFFARSAGTVTMRQARRALHQAGLTDSVNTYFAGLAGDAGAAARIDWESSSEVHRDWPLMTDVKIALNLTDTDLDNLFALAKTL